MVEELSEVKVFRMSKREEKRLLVKYIKLRSLAGSLK